MGDVRIKHRKKRANVTLPVSSRDQVDIEVHSMWLGVAYARLDSAPGEVPVT